MQVLDTALADVKIIEPTRYGDDRGWFAEVFNVRDYAAAGLPEQFVQDNQSMSLHGVLRGIHYQLGQPQGKLVRCLSGHIWDVAVDLRRSSQEFGQWAGFDLRPISEQGKLQLLWIPEGFGHAFLVLSETAEVLYKTTRQYYPQGDRSVRWDDPTLAIGWPLHLLTDGTPRVSSKDEAAKSFQEAELPE